jgi:hypothetical protein
MGRRDGWMEIFVYSLAAFLDRWMLIASVVL